MTIGLVWPTIYLATFWGSWDDFGPYILNKEKVQEPESQES